MKMGYEAVASDYKKKIVEELVKLIKEYPIIGAVDMENLPAPQLQNMRAQLRGNVVIRMTKGRLIKLALEKCKADKEKIEELEKYLKGMPALLFTKNNPFTLYKTLQKNKSSAPAKPGQIAPGDIVIPKGPTSFAPGPIIGELGSFRIKTAVEGGKIAVVEDTVVAREGDVINEKLAGLLTRFNINPMEIGLNVTAVYENGTIYPKSILAIDEKEFMNSLVNAHQWAFNLAVEAGYYTKETIDVLVPKAFNEAKAVAKEFKIMCDLIAEEMVELAEREAISVKTEGKIETGIKKPEEQKQEEAKQEAKPAEEAPKKEEKPEAEIKEPSSEELLKQAQAKADELNKKEAQKKSADESAKLFDELKKKGTLREDSK